MSSHILLLKDRTETDPLEHVVRTESHSSDLTCCRILPLYQISHSKNPKESKHLKFNQIYKIIKIIIVVMSTKYY
jgi:hypothetical protein